MDINEKRLLRRKQTAEIFTPKWLAQNMIDKIPIDYWADPKRTLLEPACGDGVFVELCILKKLTIGSSIRQAIQTVYAIDLMEDNVEETKQKVKKLILENGGTEDLFSIVEHNIKCANFLTANLDELFL
jgi:2-polyprenyl-3-methyl-5-hydroxy-6-metoxy-1,4-benzoquinol methylase